ncbi:MAG: hypothetical protein VX409_03265 [Verrucomicrobiota bacterium]|nr:hypothetical protein [Verrucomicrobiota bacterium]
MKLIKHITLALTFFSASFYAIAENKIRKEKLMSKEELTKKYDKNDNGKLDFRVKMHAAEEKIWAAVKSGKLSKEDAKKKLSSIKNKIWPSKDHDVNRDNKNRSKVVKDKAKSKSKNENNDERGIKFLAAEEKIWATVKSGKLSEKDAKKKLSSIKNKIWPSKDREKHERDHNRHDHEGHHHDEDRERHERDRNRRDHEGHHHDEDRYHHQNREPLGPINKNMRNSFRGPRGPMNQNMRNSFRGPKESRNFKKNQTREIKKYRSKKNNKRDRRNVKRNNKKK